MSQTASISRQVEPMLQMRCIQEYLSVFRRRDTLKIYYKLWVILIEKLNGNSINILIKYRTSFSVKLLYITAADRQIADPFYE